MGFGVSMHAQVPSEVLSLETRSAGFSLVTCMNFLVTFVIGQSFLSMLCAFKVSSYWRPLPVFTCFSLECLQRLHNVSQMPTVQSQAAQGVQPLPGWQCSPVLAGSPADDVLVLMHI